jgi:uncharacterized surface protein with fasciclin (FAS1) repeats
MQILKQPKEQHTFHVITSVWGDHHIRLFLDLTVPNILSSGNLPALAASGCILYRIFTTPAGREQISKSKICQRLASLVQIEYLTPLGHRVPEPVWHIHWFHRAAAEAKAAGAIVIFVPPDTLWNNGAFEHMAAHIAAGRRGIACPFLQVTSETCVRDARREFLNRRTGVLTIPSSRIWSFARRHLHPLQILGMPGSPNARPVFELHWPVDQEGILSLYAFREMTMFDPARCSITYNLNADGPEDLRDLYFGSSSEMLMLSVDSISKYIQSYILSHSPTAFDVARTTLHPLNYTRQTSLFARRPIEVRGNEIKPVAWRRRDRQARAAARTMEIGRAAMLVYRELMARGCEHMANLLSVALLSNDFARWWRAEKPVTVLATCDAALASVGCTSLSSFIAPNRKQVLKGVLLDHVIEGRLGHEQWSVSLGGTRLHLGHAGCSPTINDVKILHGPIDLEEVVLYVLDGIVVNSLASHSGKE